MKERAKKAIRPIAFFLAIGLIYAVIHLSTGFAIPCPVHTFTGLYCPGCGVTRMCAHLLRGEIIDAFWSNPAVFIIAPFLLALISYHTYAYIRYGNAKYRRGETVILYVVAGLLVIYGVGRNLL